MRKLFSFLFTFLTFFVFAQQEVELHLLDELLIDSPIINVQKDKFIDYFNLMPKAVRDYTPNDFFIEYNNEVINSVEVFIVDRFDDPVYDQKDINNAKLVENKRGISSAVLVQKQLLFNIGDYVDSRLIADTERNIRENTIYKDAVIKVASTPNISGVDIEVYVHDNRHWKAIFWGSPTSLTLGASFHDFFGVAQKLSLYGSGIINPQNPYRVGASYRVNNIARSQIDMQIDYNKQNQSEGYGFEIGRKFFAYNTKWAGKLSASNNSRKIEMNNISNEYNNKFFTTEAWLARSFGLKKVNIKHESLRLIISGRAVITNHYKIPDNQPFQNFVNKQIYLGAIGFANRDWYGFEALYKFRQFDYVPKGFNTSFIGGYEINQFLGGRIYGGVRANYNRHYPKFGFMQNELNLGSFIRNKNLEQITFQLNNSYFTNRASLGKLGFRQFINTSTTLSFNRPNSEFYNIGTSAIRGFNSQKMIGTKSFVINLESVFYTPIHWWTSRGNFFFFTDLGWLGNSNSDFLLNNTLYQGYGGGIRFQNLTLSIGYMEISFGYYPNGYIVNERNWGYQIGEIPPREVNTNNLFNAGTLNDIY
jgi:hypothetical protein